MDLTFRRVPAADVQRIRAAIDAYAADHDMVGQRRAATAWLRSIVAAAESRDTQDRRGAARGPAELAITQYMVGKKRGNERRLCAIAALAAVEWLTARDGRATTAEVGKHAYIGPDAAFQAVLDLNRIGLITANTEGDELGYVRVTARPRMTTKLLAVMRDMNVYGAAKLAERVNSTKRNVERCLRNMRDAGLVEDYSDDIWFIKGSQGGQR